MPTAVHLDFIPPSSDGLVALRIFEAPASTGPWSEIERTEAVGSYPNYITHYTTQLASTSQDWFSIAWEDAGGAVSAQSPGVQGGSSSLFQKVLQRVMDRDRFLDERVVAQEVEYVISTVLNTQTPFDVSLTATIAQVQGMVYLVLARSQLVKMLTTSTEEATTVTLGLVSMKKGSGSSSTLKMKDIENLIDLANGILGISTSVVMQLEELPICYGISSSDKSRLIGWVGLV